MKPILIEEIEIEIGYDLYLKINDIKFYPAFKGRFHGLPENWEEPEPAEFEYENKNCFIILEKNKKRLAYPAPDYFAYNYYESIIESCEYEVEAI